MEKREKRICHLNEVPMEVTHAVGKQTCGREGEGSFREIVRKSEVSEKHTGWFSPAPKRKMRENMKSYVFLSQDSGRQTQKNLRRLWRDYIREWEFRGEKCIKSLKG